MRLSGFRALRTKGARTSLRLTLIRRILHRELSPPFLPEDILPLPRRELRWLRPRYPSELDRIVAVVRRGTEGNQSSITEEDDDSSAAALMPAQRRVELLLARTSSRAPSSRPRAAEISAYPERKPPALMKLPSALCTAPLRLCLLVSMVFTSLAAMPASAGAVPVPPTAACPPAGRDLSLVRYVAPGGAGTGMTQESPYRMVDFLNAARAGWTACAASGVYTQTNGGMIVPPQGRSGTVAQTIMIAAINESDAPIVDGGHTDAFPNYPLSLRQNNNWEIEGFDFRKGGGAVIRLFDSIGLKLRRVQAWDADITKNSAVLMNFNSETLCEDCAFWGTGAVLVGNGFTSRGLTCRRCWGEWEGSTTNHSGKVAFNMGYDKPAVSICENCFVTASRRSQPTSFTVTDGDGGTKANPICSPSSGTTTRVPCPESIYRVRSGDTVVNPTYTGQLLGSLTYLRADSTWQAVGAGVLMTTIPSGWDASGFQVKDSMVYVAPTYPSFRSMRGFVLNTFSSNTNSYGHLSAVFGSGIQVFGRGWSNSLGKNSFGIALAKFGGTVADPWQTGSADGASLCFRYVDGMKTSQPLWPWAMEVRIAQATGTRTGPYTGPCVGCTGVRSRHPTVNVTAEIEGLLGTIPVGPCRS